jgi:hypothetical protein
MATRYCGGVTIKLTWSDTNADTGLHHINGVYRCLISSPITAPRKPYVIYVAAPRYLDTAVDSAEAYDSAAHAALSFLAHEAEGEWQGNHLNRQHQIVDLLVPDFDPTSWTGRGWKICRRAVDAWDARDVMKNLSSPAESGR